MQSLSPAIAAAPSLPKWPAVLALAFGLLVVYGAGFASPMALHNATHDTRHAFGLPCH
jgi:cobalt transporter subunit CbtB